MQMPGANGPSPGPPGLHGELGTGKHLLPSISSEYKQLWSPVSQLWCSLQALFQSLVLIGVEQWWEEETVSNPGMFLLFLFLFCLSNIFSTFVHRR